ncbi:PiggyBac transposable element-derived protein 4 [Eumeta japonica]|uniref:PiggyBac transposable element-derived protein 4 n=1 Tax=Eumeta variegata TaxID=151549 RepID=A0A4C1TJT9_EUMVA|nr:PiggyBac transposable element-derived protein 4 [Eumeta japonica]
MDKLRKPANIIKQKWSESSTSLRSRHIVDLALSKSDQSLRSPVPARIPSPAIPGRSSAQPSPSSSTSSPQFKRPKTVNVPDFNQPKNQVQADFEWRVSTDVEECASGTEKLLMELGVSNLVAPFPASTIQPASTHQVITSPNVHVSAGEDMPSSSRTFRVSSLTEALLDPESGSSYDDSEFSDDDDAEYVTSAKRRFSRIYQTMRSSSSCVDNDKQPLPNAKSKQPLAASNQPVTDCEEKKITTKKVSTIVMKELRPGGAGSKVGDKCIDAKRWHDTSNVEALTVWARLTRKNIPEDVKEMKKNCEKGTIIARHSGDVMVLAWKDAKIVSMISTFHDNSTYTGTRAGEECEKPICVKDYNTTMGALI